MIQTRTPSEILTDGHSMAVRFGAPLEMQTRLLQAAEQTERTGKVPFQAEKVEMLPVLQEVEAE